VTETSGAPEAVPELTDVELRIIGALIEKEVTTPEYYPLTLNALVAACNQKSNRYPVVSYDEKTVARGLQSLRDRGLARTVSGADMRVPKHYQVLTKTLGLDAPQTACMCVLLLRGPQTTGEVRGRTSRLHAFADLPAVEATLCQLLERPAGALAALLPRAPGQKEQRYAHTLAPQAVQAVEEEREAPVEPAMAAVMEEDRRLAQLADEVARLRLELDELRQQFDAFREQFD
jgi:hypothetical protein